MRLSVIIVNYNVKYFLEQCLYSVQKACAGLAVEVIVVDNHSTDESRSFLEPSFPGVRFIWNESNEGFAKANNRAISYATGEYILFLNPDTLVPEDCFHQCIRFLESKQNAAAVGVKMIDGTGRFLKESKRAFPSPLTSLYKLSGLSVLFPRSQTFARYHLGHLSENENHEVDVLAGAFMMIPRRLLDEVGSFDETFFMYGEDVDLSYRLQKAGCKNFYFSETSIIHFKGESTKRGSMNYVRMFYTAMSLFVKKHYSGTRASLFIFLIQVGILTRAFLAATASLLKKAGLPILDAATILTSFWVVKYFWNTYIRQDVNYSPNTLWIAFPVFTAAFLMVSYYSGLYDKGYKQSQLVRSTVIAGLLLLSGYGLLPETMRFSRGILLFGILLAFAVMNLLRQLFIELRLLETDDEDEEKRQTLVVANAADFDAINNLMLNAGMQERVLGRVSPGFPNEEPGSLGGIDQLPVLINKYRVREVIFCENGLSLKETISLVSKLPAVTRNKFHASGSRSIVGSDSKNVSGDYVAAAKKYRVAKPINRRNKRLFDISLSAFFIISFPVHLFLQKRPAGFYKNVFSVLAGNKSWVGYASANKQLPPIHAGVLTSTALPFLLNELPEESLQKSDEWYASEYTVMLDVQKIRSGYRYLYY
ncbi:MAG TPA: glycosyl transferase family 2 [Chitinophagaceae bacterium]|nr:glycosyl transferase family 2 [Chitinophagaceae bacterium]